MGSHLHHGMLATADLLIVGILTRNAYAAQRPTDDPGHFAPTLCLELVSLNGVHRSVVEQFFPVGNDAGCAAAAKRLTKGMCISYEVPVHNIMQKHIGVSHIKEIDPTTLATPSRGVLIAPAQA